MIVLSYSVALTIAALSQQVLIWRVHLPKSQTKTLLLIFLLVLILGLLCSFGGLLPRLTVVQAFHLSLVHIAGALAYACLYSALEAESPTVAIVRFTAEGGDRGRRRDEYATIINDDLIVGSRFRSLASSGVVIDRAGKFYLTAKGKRVARFFTTASQLLRMRGAG